MFDSSRFGSAAVTGGELCFKLAEPSVHPVDVVLRQRPLAMAKGHHYQLRFKVARDRADQGAPAPVQDQRPLHGAVGGDGRRRCDGEDVHRARTTATTDDDSIELAIEFGGPLTGRRR